MAKECVRSDFDHKECGKLLKKNKKCHKYNTLATDYMKDKNYIDALTAIDSLRSELGADLEGDLQGSLYALECECNAEVILLLCV